MSIYLEIADVASELKYILILTLAGYLFGKWLIKKYVDRMYPDEPDKPDDIPQ
jgi:hypothetical protein